MTVTTSSSRDPVSRLVDLANNEDLGERTPGERGDAVDIEDDNHVPNLTKLERLWWRTKQWLDRLSGATRLTIAASFNAGPGLAAGGLAWAIGASPPAAVAAATSAVVITGSV